MGASAASWTAALPIGAAALLVLVLPGWVAARLLGVRGFAGLAVGPAVSVTMITLGGVAASLLGIGWRPVTLLGAVLLTWLVALGVGMLLRRPGGYAGRRRRPSASPDVGEPATRGAVTARGRLGSLVGEWLWPLVGLAVAAVGLAVAFLPVAGRPSSFPQQPDTVFHLSTVQWMLDRHDISVLHAAGYVYGSPRFYPAGFHDVVVSVLQLCGAVGIGGATPVVGSTMVALATAAIVWPLGCLLLARVVLGPGLALMLATGVTATAFSAFPLWLMGYGVLWPNLLGYALMPAALACLAVAVRPPHLCPTQTAVEASGSGLSGAKRLEWSKPAWVLLAVGLPGIALAHPNALISVAVLGLLVVLDAVLTRAWAWRRTRPAHAVGLLAAALVGTALVAAGYALVTQRMTAMRVSNPPGPEMSLRTALEQAVLGSPRGAPPLHVLGVIVLLGALVLLVRGRGRRWVVAALLLTAGLYVMVVGIDSETTRWFTWPWYNNPPRLAALLVLPGVLCAATALALPATALRWWSGRRSAGSPTSGTKAKAGVAAVAVGLAVLVPAGFVVATGGYVDQHRDIIDRYWHPAASRSWASTGELAALRELATHIGPRDVTAANPWNGGTYLYLVSGRELLIPTEKVRGVEDRSLLADRLDEVGTDAAVCAAVERHQVRFVITGGWPAGGGGASEQYPGIDAVPTSDAFARVATAGPYTLWRLTSCAGD
jgi:hypothetical protein